MLQLVLLAFLVTTLSAETCNFNSIYNPSLEFCVFASQQDGNGLWNDWSDWSICSATCGLCGTQIRTRTCASQPYGCPCTGNAMEVRRCGASGCTGKPCCDGTYKAVAYDGTIFCQLEPPITPPGTWQPWFATSFCNDTCGMCGTMTQARYCMPTGSQCNGNFTQQIACGDGWCSSPKPPCCPGFMKSQNPITNADICVP
ncbi:unnamed protein product, partial [Mesorhabditis belari]|uniref:Uncharacterized protein n=1 Tax=Mesorhabditis belari TaxID=2138241 RepID=A0AAF3F9U9_9BILA